MGKNEYLGRGIYNSQMLLSLTEGNLKEMLMLIKDDRSLDVQIRMNRFNIYYQGGSIATINSEKSVSFDESYFDLGENDCPNKEILSNTEITNKLKKKRDLLVHKFTKEKNYKEYFQIAKKVMDEWFDIHPNPERKEQHLLRINTINLITLLLI